MLIVLSWVPVIMGLMGRKPGWALIGFFGVSVMIITVLVVGADGSITQGCGSGCTYTLASANGNFISDFNLVGYVLPIAMALAESYVVIRRAFNI